MQQHFVVNLAGMAMSFKQQARHTAIVISRAGRNFPPQTLPLDEVSWQVLERGGQSVFDMRDVVSGSSPLRGGFVRSQEGFCTSFPIRKKHTSFAVIASDLSSVLLPHTMWFWVMVLMPGNVR